MKKRRFFILGGAALGIAGISWGMLTAFQHRMEMAGDQRLRDAGIKYGIEISHQSSRLRFFPHPALEIRGVEVSRKGETKAFLAASKVRIPLKQGNKFLPSPDFSRMEVPFAWLEIPLPACRETESAISSAPLMEERALFSSPANVWKTFPAYEKGDFRIFLPTLRLGCAGRDLDYHQVALLVRPTADGFSGRAAGVWKRYPLSVDFSHSSQKDEKRDVLSDVSLFGDAPFASVLLGIPVLAEGDVHLQGSVLGEERPPAPLNVTGNVDLTLEEGRIYAKALTPFLGGMGKFLAGDQSFRLKKLGISARLALPEVTVTAFGLKAKHFTLEGSGKIVPGDPDKTQFVFHPVLSLGPLRFAHHYKLSGHDGGLSLEELPEGPENQAD